MAEGFLGGCVSEVASILGVCEQSQKHAQHQNQQPDGFFALHSIIKNPNHRQREDKNQCNSTHIFALALTLHLGT